MVSLRSSGKDASSNAARRRSRAKIEPTLWIDVTQILNDGLRKQDVDELAAQGNTPEDTLSIAAHDSGHLCFTIHVDGVAAAIFGVVPLASPGHGSPWLLGSDRVLTIPRELVREGRVWVDWLASVYPHLENYVDARNTVSIAWLKSMGFTFDGASFPASHHPTFFRRFTRCVSPSALPQSRPA